MRLCPCFKNLGLSDPWLSWTGRLSHDLTGRRQQTAEHASYTLLFRYGFG